jgi:subtilisin
LKKLVPILLCLTIILSLMPLTMANVSGQSGEKQKVIVGFNNQANPEIIRGLGGEIDHFFGEISAIATSLPQAAIDALKRNPNIAYVEPDAQVWATAEELPWGVDRIDSGIDTQAPVHNYNTGVGVKVAVIDTGIYYDHPDLLGRYAGGYDFVNDDGDPMDDNGHGTHVAGTIAAVLGNGVGVVGVAPSAQIYALKVLGSDGSGDISDVIAAIYTARDYGAKIISMSLGGPGSSTLQAACDSVYNSGAGVLIVAAAGNDYTKIGARELDTIDYPARYSSVIAVGATDSSDLKASFSSTGSTVELAAPGVDIRSTFPPTISIGGQTGYYYAVGSGTSMACPHVSGAAALVWAGEPTLTAGQVRQRLVDTADDLGSSGRDKWYGYGIVDVDQAAPQIGPQPPVANAGSDVSVNDAYNDGVELVTLDASASFDLDGTIMSWAWKLNNVVIGTAKIVEYPFSIGTNIVTLTVTDNQGLSDSDSVTITVTPYQELQSMGVADITMTTAKTANKGTTTAAVTVEDAANNPVGGVTVTGHWEGATTTGSISGTTDTNGMVSFKSASVKLPSGKVFTFVVENLEKTGYEYDIALNFVNPPKNSVTFP